MTYTEAGDKVGVKGFLIPVEGPCREVFVPADDSLHTMQRFVGGYIEAVGIPDFINGWETGTAYVNEEGKLEHLEANMRATDFMVPGVGIMFRDYIAGDMLLLGWDPETGENADVPQGLVDRARLIEREA